MSGGTMIVAVMAFLVVAWWGLICLIKVAGIVKGLILGFVFTVILLGWLVVWCSCIVSSRSSRIEEKWAAEKKRQEKIRALSSR
jgi:hypothetical protein